VIGRFAKTDVVRATPSTPVRDAARLMAERRVGLVVLVDSSNPYRVVGVVSERDVVRAVASGVDPSAPCYAIATKNVVTIDCDDSVSKAAELMLKHGIRHLVVTREGRLYGVVSIRDLVHERAALRELAAYCDWAPEPGMSS